MQFVPSYPDKYQGIPEQEIFERIKTAKQKLGSKAVILGHHYQRDEVFQFADITGDSLKLSMEAANRPDADYIVFCGVHFMAETADIVNDGKKIVTLPDATAGCPMADSAKDKDVRRVWDYLMQVISEFKICPITYINCYASLKAFCGENGGTICTSSNALKVVEWGFKNFDKIFFFPDQHLGRNIAKLYGIPKDEIVLVNFRKPDLGVTVEQLQKARVILWNGMCPVHDRFMVEDIFAARIEDPTIKVLVHPEVPESVADNADLMGSTEYIIKTVSESPAGSSWLVATEVHLVGRLIKNHPDKKIKLLGKPICMCSQMDRTSPEHLCWNLESLVKGEIVNQVSVDPRIIEWSKVALQRMFDITLLNDEPNKLSSK
jgi:quinolinate synthase